MAAQKKDRSAGRGWRGVAVVTAGIAVIGGAGWWVRSAMLPRANAQNTVAVQSAAPAPAAPATAGVETDYASRVVAYLYETEPVTREQLGEYLIERYGADKLELLINRRIIDDACRKSNVEVTAGEVEAALAEELQGLAIDRATFVNTLLARYRKNLYEWKEDVIRPKLQLTKLCRGRVQATDDDIRKAFETAYGEKIECQIILWPNTKQGEADAMADYARLRDSAEAFDQKAKAQPKPELAATAGKVKPFGRYVMGDDNFDRVVFRLRPNEVSEVIKTVDGPVVVKCLRHYPADTSIRIDTVRDKLVKQIIDKQVAREMQTAFQTLKKQARPEIKLKKKDKAEANGSVPATDGGPRSRQVVAIYNGQTPITREDLGEFLIARHGVEKLEFLINRRIIDKECQARKVNVTPQEIEAAFADDLKKLNVDVKTFEKDFLGRYNKNLYEWREDVIRPRLLLAKLCRDRVKVTEAELKMAYEAHYGEKLDCRMILWPPEQIKFALMEYTQIRDNPAAFDEKAKHQPSATLAAQGGKLPRFGRHTLGEEEVEREAFKLQPGDMTTLIGTPQGSVVVKLDRRIPPDKSVSLESVRAKLTQEVYEKKVQIEMQTAFQVLRKTANPKQMLKDPNKPIDIKAETAKLLPPDTLKGNQPTAKH